MRLEIGELVKKATSRLDMGQHQGLRDLDSFSFWQPHPKFLLRANYDAIIITEDVVPRLHNYTTHLDLQLDLASLFGCPCIGVAATAVYRQGHLKKQRRVPAVSVNDHSRNTLPCSLIRNQLTKHAPSSGPCKVFVTASHAGVYHDHISGLGIMDSRKDFKEVAINLHSPSSAYHVVARLQGVNAVDHARLLPTRIAQGASIHSGQASRELL
mmetsp:Transcript_38896/g.90047  ORF Transcript_38896/g.90047 Transcript_38896/m.90047 type:complete len:212 (-) Transcript_38896:107-742(-)